MKRKSLIGLILSIAMVSLVFAGCGSSSTSEKNQDSTKSSSEQAATLKDGNYKVEASNFDSRGWKPFVEIQVKSGKIISAKYDYINKQGKYKTQDEDYNKQMTEKDKGMNPVKYTKLLTDDLVSKQDISKVDSVSGATTSTKNFKSLVQKAVENAKSGNTSESKIDIAE